MRVIEKLTDTISVLLLGVIVFMNLISVSTNTSLLSNPLQVDLNLTQVLALSETESEIAILNLLYSPLILTLRTSRIILVF